MDHIFEALQNSFLPDENVIFIANVKDERQVEGDLLLTNKKLIFYPFKATSLNSVLFIPINLIDNVAITDKGIVISSGTNQGIYQMEILKEDFISKLIQMNDKIKID